MQDNHFNGVLPDTRPQELKDRDFKSDNPELPSGAGQINWIEKTPEQWVKYDPRYQIWSSSCLVQAFCKACRTMGYPILSAYPPYRLRTNFSGPGSWMWDIASLFKKIGTVLETQATSQNVGEDILNKNMTAELEALLADTPFKIGGYVYLAKNNFDNIAQAVQDHKHCILTFGANNSEWKEIPFINGTPDWYHGICATDLTLRNSKKYIVIDDSIDSNTFPNNQRLLSEEFINQRITGGVYLIPAVPPEPTDHIFTRPLKKGQKDPEVRFLQEKLKKLGYFPQIACTNFYGSITAKSLLKFQLAYNVDKPEVLNQLKGEHFGPKSIKAINKTN